MRMRRITATLTTRGPYHSGTGASDARGDAPLRRDQIGRPELPGTSLAGALRAACRRRLGDTDAERCFGSLQEHDVGERASGSTLEHSRVVVYDARPIMGAAPHQRPHVGIDRDRLVARAGILFDRESWPGGLRFAVTLDCEEDALSAALVSLEALAEPGGGIGAGPCPVRIDDVAVLVPRRDPAACFDLARRRWDTPGAPEPADPLDEDPERPAHAPAQGARLRLCLRCVDPLISRVPLDRNAPIARDEDIDALPFAAPRLTPAGTLRWDVGLPGSGLRGVLRTRAERIVGEISGDEVPDPWATSEEHVVARVFGWATDGEGGAAGRVRVSDALTDPELAVEGDDAAAGLGHPALSTRSRVRTDRLTGGTYGSSLYRDTYLREDTELWTEIDVVAGPDGRLAPADAALLAAALRDVLRGDVGLGASTRSGYGTVALVSGSIALHGQPPKDVVVREDGSMRWPDAWRDLVTAGWTELTAQLRGKEPA